MSTTLSRSEKIKYIFIITVIFTVACIETDMYLPALPDMMRYFHTTEAMIQGLLSWNFIGICLSGPFYGPLSDAYGRKKLLLFAMGLFALGSLGTTLAGSIEWMLFWRVLQGLGCGGCFTIGTAIIFDRFHHQEATKVINDLNSIIPVIMATAPLAGAYLNIHYGFRSNFLVIAVLSLLSFFTCFFMLDETLDVQDRSEFNFRRILAEFGTAMTCFKFWAPTLLVSFIFAGYLSYISYSSVLFVNDLGVSKSLFPWYQVSVLLAFVSASLSCNRMLNHVGTAKTKQYGLCILMLGGLSFMTCAYLWPKSYNVFHLGMVLFSFGAGWLIGPYFTESMEALPDIKGVTASLVTSFRLLFTALFIAAINHFFDATVIPLVVGFIFLLLMGGGVFVCQKK